MSNGHINISLFHIFIIAPLFLYVAIIRGQLVPWIFWLLFGLGLIVLLYHSYKVFLKWKAQSVSVWVNIIHVLIVAPLLIFIGASNYDTPRWAYEVLAMLAFATFGYHVYSIITTVQEMNDSH